MKRLLLLIVLCVTYALTNAQNALELNIEDYPTMHAYVVCLSDNYQQAVVHAQNGCNEFYWEVYQPNGSWNNYSDDPLVINIGNYLDEDAVEIVYYGCSNMVKHLFLVFHESHIPASSTQIVWKRQGETTILDAPLCDWCIYQWPNGETTPSVEVLEQGTYPCIISDEGSCGNPATINFIVRDNVEIYRSGVDPMTNKNKVRWNTTPEQAQYVSSVKIERDGMVVGSVPYADGEFLDNIGSENAARVYKITAIDTDGNECPLPSYQFGTFNTIISPDIANPSLMNFTWEDPFIEEGSPYSVIAYRIGRFNEDTGEFIMLDQLSANVHLGKYNMDLFGGDYGIVAAVFNDAKNRDYEELAFSNRSDSGIVGIGELENDNFKVYPNPANGVFTVEGTGILRITNVLGQEIMSKEIDGKETVELPRGVYFVQLNGVVRKIVVE